jgi:hypothetical protein
VPVLQLLSLLLVPVLQLLLMPLLLVLHEGHCLSPIQCVVVPVYRVWELLNLDLQGVAKKAMLVLGSLTNHFHSLLLRGNHGPEATLL